MRRPGSAIERAFGELFSIHPSPRVAYAPTRSYFPVSTLSFTHTFISYTPAFFFRFEVLSSCNSSFSLTSFSRGASKGYDP